MKSVAQTFVEETVYFRVVQPVHSAHTHLPLHRLPHTQPQHHSSSPDRQDSQEFVDCQDLMDLEDAPAALDHQDHPDLRDPRDAKYLIEKL